MKNYVLQTRILNDTHTGVHIGTVLREACEEWNIQDKKPALVTDNASNMSIAGKEASLSPHIKCFAHTINLTTQKGLKCAGAVRLLGRVRRIVAFFHRSTVATAVFKEKQRLLELPEHKLKHDVVTRWNSSFDMLERFLEQQAAVCASLLDRRLRKGASDMHTLSEDDITTAEEMVKLLGPVKAATTVMCEEEQPTVSVIAPLQAKLLDHLKAASEDLTLITEMKETMKRELEQRYVDVQQVLHKASALDPRFKKLPFLREEERDATFQCLIQDGLQRLDQKVLRSHHPLLHTAVGSTSQYKGSPGKSPHSPEDQDRTRSVSAVAPVKVNLHDSATLPCSGRCSGVVTWTEFSKPTDALAECDQTSCRSKEGYQMIHDQYLKGNFSLIITDAHFTKRALYTCDCDGKDLCDVKLQIEPSNTTVQMEPGESLVLKLDMSDPVEVIYNSTDTAGPSSDQICTVYGRSLQCKSEYTQRASVTSALELRGVTPSDSGVYTVMDKRNEEVIHTYIVTVRDVQDSEIWKRAYEKGNSDGYQKGVVFGALAVGVAAVAIMIGVFFLVVFPRVRPLMDSCVQMLRSNDSSYRSQSEEKERGQTPTSNDVSQS
ncbi:hypothetical protein MHYP_G00127040 [Metynnis hypsauchen]